MGKNTGACSTEHVWRSGENLWELTLPFQDAGPGIKPWLSGKAQAPPSPPPPAILLSSRGFYEQEFTSPWKIPGMGYTYYEHARSSGEEQSRNDPRWRHLFCLSQALLPKRRDFCSVAALSQGYAQGSVLSPSSFPHACHPGQALALLNTVSVEHWVCRPSPGSAL